MTVSYEIELLKKYVSKGGRAFEKNREMNWIKKC